MKKIKFIFVLASLAISLSSCLQKGLIQFQPKNDEIVATPQIKAFMKNNQNPSIVLRVPTVEKQATQSDPNNYIYNSSFGVKN
jgi:predicted small lipoprotein YifL